MSRNLVLSLAVALASQGVASRAAAAPKDAAATALAKEAMDSDYLATRFKEAEQKLKQALKECGKLKCSAKVRATVHRDLAVVYIAGLKKKDKGKKEMKEALAADATLQLNPDFSSPDIEKIYEAAGGVHQAEPAKPVSLDEDEDEDEGHKPVEDEPKPAEESADGALKNWFSLSFQQDFLSYRATTSVCGSQTARGADQYQCFLEGESFEGTIYPGSGNELQSGVGLATRRLLIGFDRVFADNVTLGLRLGFAFAGSPKATTPDAKGFLPLHAELRGSYWFGEKPFVSAGLRPYAGLAVGLAELDGHVTVEYFADDAGFQRNAKGKLDAWRKTGNTLLGAHAGLAYAFSREHEVFLELRLLQMLGASAFGGAIKLGYAYGM